jgi:hypothetical protein
MPRHGHLRHMVFWLVLGMRLKHAWYAASRR